MIVGEDDESTFPADHQAVYDRLTGVEHNDLYDREPVNTAVGMAAEWFTIHLG